MFLGGLYNRKIALIQFYCKFEKKMWSFFPPRIVLTIVKTGQQNSISPLLLLHVPDAFLINGGRMDGLTEGPDNNGWSTGHKCSYWGDLWASAHRRLSSNPTRWFLKAPADGRRPVRGKALFSRPAASFINHIFGLKPLWGSAPGKEQRRP